MDWEPLMLMVAPNGARKTRDDHPALPLTPAEIAAEAERCADAGAALLHLHVRDTAGRHSLSPELYREAIAAVRERVGERLVIQATTEAVQRYTPSEQIDAVMALRPESVSVALRELLPAGDDVTQAADFFRWLRDEQVVPQFIIYAADDLVTYAGLRDREVIPAMPQWLLLVLGRYSVDQTSQPGDLLPFMQALPDRVPWAVCAFGPQEHACGTCAASLGGHVRVGFENNLRLKDGGTAPDNAALVRQMAAAADALGRPLASAAQVRERFARRV
jgi:uncharacterized protein (DUF849 family)